MRRAARWDGACLYKATAAGSTEDSATGLAPADVHELKRFVAAHRTSTTPLEIVVGGRGRSADWDSERVAIQALAEAGATWWIEWIPPSEPDVMRAAIERGPLRID